MNWGRPAAVTLVIVLACAVTWLVDKSYFTGKLWMWAGNEPESVREGPIGALQEGDKVTIDVDARRIDVDLSDEEIAARVAAYESPPSPDRTGVLAKYAALVGSASQGAVTLAD